MSLTDDLKSYRIKVKDSFESSGINDITHEGLEISIEQEHSGSFIIADRVGAAIAIYPSSFIALRELIS